MHIKMNKDKTAAGPGGVILAGKSGEMDDEQAAALIAGGYATAVRSPPETADMNPKTRKRRAARQRTPK